MYPRKLKHENKFNPELIINWMKMTKLDIDVANKKNKIAQY